ncbi:MAG: lipoate--protein ligase family protein, partial [Candidatus Thorarchaeota archaeon]|nr:lipoate--protein ligase family protein [Candidatus Thorarchaeota archaeon]
MSVANVRMTEWRLLDTGVLTGAQNMALDDVILECRSENKTPNTVRFLQFDPPTALVGYHQSIEQEIR